MTKQTEKIKQDLIVLGLVIGLSMIIAVIFPEHKEVLFHTSWRFFLEMIAILPGIMLLIGIFSVWISKDKVMKYLGNQSGWKGGALAILFGALPTGPLYVAFPIAAWLKAKGASIANIIIFLTAWACIKIPQEMVEWQFLGFRFMILRMMLTIVAAIIMGTIIEFIITKIIKSDF